MNFPNIIHSHAELCLCCHCGCSEEHALTGVRAWERCRLPTPNALEKWLSLSSTALSQHESTGSSQKWQVFSWVVYTSSTSSSSAGYWVTRFPSLTGQLHGGSPLTFWYFSFHSCKIKLSCQAETKVRVQSFLRKQYMPAQTLSGIIIRSRMEDKMYTNLLIWH